MTGVLGVLRGKFGVFGECFGRCLLVFRHWQRETARTLDTLRLCLALEVYLCLGTKACDGKGCFDSAEFLRSINASGPNPAKRLNDLGIEGSQQEPISPLFGIELARARYMKT